MLNLNLTPKEACLTKDLLTEFKGSLSSEELTALEPILRKLDALILA